MISAVPFGARPAARDAIVEQADADYGVSRVPSIRARESAVCPVRDGAKRAPDRAGYSAPM